MFCNKYNFVHRVFFRHVRRKTCHSLVGECVRMMLAFDIETMGLDPRKSAVTCVCVEDFHSGRKYKFEFARARHERPGDLPELQRQLVELLEAAPSLCAFNGIRFDTPFLQVVCGLDAATVRRWNSKTTDILERCREVHRHTFSLNKLCEANDITVKSGDGLAAIQLAREHKWDELAEYCEHDVHILCELYRKRHLKNPRNGVQMDLAAWTHDYVYATQGGGHAAPADAVPAAAPADAVPAAAPADPFAHWLQAVAARVDRLPCVEVPASDVFGVCNRFCVARCPTCDAEGFIQEDTQCMSPQRPQAVYACGMQHAYRIRLGPA
jgi:hypothetical protein